MAIKIAVFVAAVACALSVAAATCPSGFIEVNGACAKTCNSPAHNSLRGLCTGGANPYAGVYCNSVEGTSVGILETDRSNVNTGYVCKKNSDCDKYGAGYFCNFYAPKGQGDKSTPKPVCSRPAAPACFPLIPVSPSWPKCTSLATCPE